MTAPAAGLDYFALEAADCLARVRRWQAAANSNGQAHEGTADDARAAARALRGAAEVAREPGFVALGAALADAAVAAASGPLMGDVAAALDAALDAGEAALRTRPRSAGAAERVRAAATALAHAARATTSDEFAPVSGANASDARVVPVRALAYDGDADFIVYRSESPPTTADQRFRDASLPLARALRRLVTDARAALEETSPAALAQTFGVDLHAAVSDLRELAEGYDVAPARQFFARRAAGAAALDPRSLAALDSAAAGLLGESTDAPSRPATNGEEPDAVETPTTQSAPVVEPAEPVTPEPTNVIAIAAVPPEDADHVMPAFETASEAANAEAASDVVVSDAVFDDRDGKAAAIVLAHDHSTLDPEPPTTSEIAPEAAPEAAPGPPSALTEPLASTLRTAEPIAGSADEFRPPTGEALVALLETGISGLGAIGALPEHPLAEPASDGRSPNAEAPNASTPDPGGRDTAAASDPDVVVPVEQLLYRGRPALLRARAVRDLLRARPGPPDPALLDELYDLLDLAAAD